MGSGPGEARTILLLHIISVRHSKQPLMVRTFLKVYMELGSSFLFLQEQIKDIIIIIGTAYQLRRELREAKPCNNRERVLFIGTQFSILYTSMYSPAEAATPRA